MRDKEQKEEKRYKDREEKKRKRKRGRKRKTRREEKKKQRKRGKEDRRDGTQKNGDSTKEKEPEGAKRNSLATAHQSFLVRGLLASRLAPQLDSLTVRKGILCLLQLLQRLDVLVHARDDLHDTNTYICWCCLPF